MGQLAITLEVLDRRCLVVGAGAVAQRKIASLTDAGAHVTVVAPDVPDAVSSMSSVACHEREFAEADVAGHELVFACTDSREVNADVAHTAHAAGVWVNVVDDVSACDFFVNAAVQRGNLTIAIGTGGASPALGRRIRLSLEQQFGEAYGPFVDVLGRLRDEVIQTEPNADRRRAAFARMAAVPCETVVAEHGIAGLEDAVRAAMRDTEAVA